MKNKILKAFFLLVLFLTVGLFSCSKEDEPGTNVSPYDLKDPGLYNEHVGEVKWIFSLEGGEMKTLDINGSLYEIYLKNTYWAGEWDNEPYFNILVNGDSVSVSALSTRDHFLGPDLEQSISMVTEMVKGELDTAGSLEEFESVRGKLCPITSSLFICHTAFSAPVLGNADTRSEGGYYIAYFLIIERKNL